jgi:hypothetical protein
MGDNINSDNFDLVAFSLIHPLMSRLINARRIRDDVIGDVVDAIRGISQTGRPLPQVLDEERVAALTRIVFQVAQKDDYINIECPIDLRSFEDGETVVQLPCSHLFGEASICKWLQERKSQCPACRADIPGTAVAESRLTDTQIENLAHQWINTRVLLEMLSVTMDQNENLSDALDLRRSILDDMMRNMRD